MDNTARLGLDKIQADHEVPVSDLAAAINTNADKLDGAVLRLSGTGAPASGTAGVEGRVYRDTDAESMYYDTGSMWAPLTSPLLTALPASPVDGQVISFLADASNGVVWQLRYRAASLSEYKWEYVGGSDLVAVAASLAAPVDNTAYTALSNPLNLTLPCGGDFDIEIGAFALLVPNSAGDDGGYVGYAIGGVAPSDYDAASTLTATTSSGGSLSAQKRKTGLASGTVLSAQAHVDRDASFYINNPYLRVRPIRVG